MRKTKLLSLFLIFALAVSMLAACGQPPVPAPDDTPNDTPPQTGADQPQLPAGQGDRQAVSFIVNGQQMEEDYCVLDTEILTVAYDDKVLYAERPDFDDREIATLESADPLDLDVEIYAGILGDYISAAERELADEIKDDDVRLHSEQASDIDVNGNNAKYFTVSDEDSCSEYYFIEYTGTVSPNVKYVVFKANYEKGFTTDWSPRLYAMAKTITFK